MVTINGFKNSTTNIDDYGSLLDSLFKKKSHKYDIIIYNSIYSSQYADYLVDLRTLLDDEHLSLYIPGIASNISIINDKVVGLPIDIKYNVLYSNKYLLKKYNYSPPETWEELIFFENYIRQRENYFGRTINGFLGHIPDSESSLCSALEFIDSYRDDINSEFPGYISQNAIDGFNKLKEVKEKTSSTDELYQLKDNEVINYIKNGGALFITFWDSPIFYSDNYIVSKLPARRSKFSSTCLEGYNIGINNYISESQKKAASIVLKFMTTKEMQKKYAYYHSRHTAILSLYDDEEFCNLNITDCENFRDVHYVLRNSLSPNDYISYSRKFRKIFFNFIYGNETSENTLQKLENITKINYIELNSVFGLTVILISTIGIASTVVSTLLVGDERYKQHFNLLESYQWFFYSLGIIILFSYGYTEIGKVTDFKCHLQEFITQTGYTFCMIPIFLKLIIIIPKRNNFSQFVKKNFTTLVFLFFVVDGIFFGFQFISSYTPVTVYVENGLNFQVCKINMNIGKIILWIIAANKFIVLVIILILLFIEWNVKYRYIHIKELANLIYTDLIGFIMIIIVHFLNVNNIHTQLLLKLFPIYFFTIVNLFLTFIIKILSVIFKEDDYITKYQNNNNNSNNSSNKSSISSDEIIEQINSKSQYEPSVNLVTSEYKIENIENWSSENNCANDGLQK